MRKATTMGAIVALGMSGAVFGAEGVSHTFIEAGYGYGELGGSQVTGDGLKLGGSIELPANFVAAASYRDFTFEDGGLDASISELGIGLGYKCSVGDAFSIVSGVSFEQLDIEGESESGFGINVDARGRLTEKLELAAGLHYVDISPVPSTFNVSLGVRHHITPAFSIGVDVRKSDFVAIASETTFIAMVRYEFGSLFN